MKYKIVLLAVSASLLAASVLLERVETKQEAAKPNHMCSICGESYACTHEIHVKLYSLRNPEHLCNWEETEAWGEL